MKKVIGSLDDYWISNATFASRIGGYVKDLSGEKNSGLQLVKSRLPIDAQVVISYSVRVNAIKGRA
jgi:hypothetical protein